MRRILLGGGALLLAGFVLSQLDLLSDATAEGEKGKKAMVIHDVYFALKDNSPAARQKLVAACQKYLTKHEGEVFFAAGVLADELKRSVNDRDFDVGLHIVFRDMKAHDLYQDHPRHTKFIDENKDNWKKVRVFDTVASE